MMCVTLVKSLTKDNTCSRSSGSQMTIQNGTFHTIQVNYHIDWDRVFQIHLAPTNMGDGPLGSQISREKQNLRAQGLANSVYPTGISILATMQAIRLEGSWKDLFNVYIWFCRLLCLKYSTVSPLG